jgi:hypothetical protein
MQTKTVQARQLALALLAVLMLVAVAFTLPVRPTEAQGASATATPNDPIWLAFSVARNAIQAEKKVDLTLVRSWEFEQADWTAKNGEHPAQLAGIDSCVSTVGILDARPLYYGWNFTIVSLNGTVYAARTSFDRTLVAVCDILSQTVAAPAPAASPVAGLPPSVAPGSAAVGNFELGGHAVGLSTRTVEAMKQAGMTWVKKQIPGGTPLGNAVAVIQDGKSKGFKVLLGVLGDKDRLGQIGVDAYAPEYAAYVAELAKQGADAIEVWNEPNIDREWPGPLISGANYTKLLAVASNAIRTANKNTMVISAAPSPTGFFGSAGCGAQGCNDDVFMEQMAQAGAAQYFDCLGLHYNEGVVPPTANSGDPRDNYPTRYFSSMTARGQRYFPGKPVCYTELGYLSGEGMGKPIPAGFNWTPDDPVTVQEQAEWLAGAATLGAARGVRLMIVWNVDFTRWDSDPMGGYAIIRPDNSCPACATLGAVMKR